ncbi:DUF2862 domain-containing protein [Thermosynechococcaceae cyanobacterium BACA0444]|uniref:DUF2862 domain-containing protein n=1 Tax=Pseudocalidococcus azoricus BACA0444 TaxID=2918990 RepID=A0AAE4FUE9_9CYAN|nr:DUF2862 domain-containing protein [Pseudocalidococcus azoricus]MDS3862073.1 DUF2862 domain-containing protein [Pseudocalidococcus azoricus BACA0444]
MEVGQKVRVCRIRDRVNQGVANTLGKFGVITGFKMTDGSGVGVVVKFEGQGSTWFFEDEIEVVP